MLRYRVKNQLLLLSLRASLYSNQILVPAGCFTWTQVVQVVLVTHWIVHSWASTGDASPHYCIHLLNLLMFVYISVTRCSHQFSGLKGGKVLKHVLVIQQHVSLTLQNSGKTGHMQLQHDQTDFASLDSSAFSIVWNFPSSVFFFFFFRVICCWKSIKVYLKGVEHYLGMQLIQKGLCNERCYRSTGARDPMLLKDSWSLYNTLLLVLYASENEYICSSSAKF